MLTVNIPASEVYDEANNEFIEVRATSITLEHSLLSISKWESKWHKPFLGKEEKTEEEMLDYIRCMTLTQNVNPDIYRALPQSVISEISDYIANPMTATWFSNVGVQRRNTEVVTSELIYYWMVALQIPFECQKWHLNRLLTLIRICELKNRPGKKMSRSAVLKRNHALNEARKASMHTRG